MLNFETNKVDIVACDDNSLKDVVVLQEAICNAILTLGTTDNIFMPDIMALTKLMQQTLLSHQQADHISLIFRKNQNP